MIYLMHSLQTLAHMCPFANIAHVTEIYLILIFSAAKISVKKYNKHTYTIAHVHPLLTFFARADISLQQKHDWGAAGGLHQAGEFGNHGRQREPNLQHVADQLQKVRALVCVCVCVCVFLSLRFAYMDWLCLIIIIFSNVMITFDYYFFRVMIAFDYYFF